MFLQINICLSLFILANCQTVFRDVNTDQGPVRGFNVDDDEVFSFYGIPYATAPRGEDRFKAPLPPLTWTMPFNATSRNVICPQGGNFFRNTQDFNTTFDCLILNIFAPETQETNIPVYVYIHGGAFQFGYSTEIILLDMVQRGIIVVTINYRLGLHGLLCLGTEYAPGNAGMKDQVAALRWVSRNIANFGGNPDTITIGGSSAGSVSSELQLLSPMSNGLFTKVILESGSTLGWDSVTFTPLVTAERFANSRGEYFNQNVEQLEQYFRSLTDDEMNLAYPSDHRTVGFLPCIESHNLTGVEKFLTGPPLDIIREKNFEQRTILTGFTPMEGLLFINRYDSDVEGMAANFSDFLPTNIEFESTEHMNEVAQKVKQFYFPTGEITVAGHIDYFTDMFFAYPQYLSARMYAEISLPVYLYLFTFNGTVNLPTVHLSPIWGPGHIAQSLYIYEWLNPTMYQFMTEYDFLTQERLRTMWENFIEYGKPIHSMTEILNVNWEPLNNSLVNFLNIDLELNIDHRPLAERFALWDEVYKQFQEPTQSEFIDVNTDQGPVRGYNVDDDEVFSFYGIPYATAPRGEDRFKAPLPPPSWTVPFNATSRDVFCPQANSLTTTFDCLILNIFVPETQETNIPVYVYIHGGGFQFGYSTENSVIDMAKGGIIVVTINYRLGLHGLLCLGTEYAPGNAGMKDQVAALRWVKRNIANFGGNPDTITIGGNSAGSGSSEIQLLSPMSNGLFTKVILESGSTLSWDFVTLTPLLTAERFANSRGEYTNQNVEQLEQYFRSLTDDEMNLAFPSDHKTIGFLPCIESHNLTGVEKFLTEPPLDIIRRENFEQRTILIGFTPMEGLLFINRYASDAEGMAANFSDFLPTNIEFKSTEHRDEVSEKVKQFYFPTGEITVAGHIDYFTDMLFAYPQYLSARMYAETSLPVYLYLFTFNGTVNLPTVHLSPIWGPGHIAQSLYIYEWLNPTIYQLMTEDDYLTQERLRTMWQNFIKYGEPIPSRTELLDVNWEPLNNTLMNYLNIDLELTVDQHPLAERFALWDEIYGHFQQPIPDSAVVFTLTLPLLSVITAVVLFI